MISINYSCRCSWNVVTFIWKLHNKNIEIISIVIKPHYKPVFIVKKLPIIFYLRLLTSTWTFLMTKIVLHSPCLKGDMYTKHALERLHFLVDNCQILNEYITRLSCLYSSKFKFIWTFTSESEKLDLSRNKLIAV